MASISLLRAIARTQRPERQRRIPGMPLEVNGQQGLLHHVLGLLGAKSSAAEPAPRNRPDRWCQGASTAGCRQPYRRRWPRASGRPNQCRARSLGFHQSYAPIPDAVTKLHIFYVEFLAAAGDRT